MTKPPMMPINPPTNSLPRIINGLAKKVRPLNIVFGTMNSDLSFKQKMLLAWLAPRGIVAAAVASYFAIELEKNGIDGAQLRAMVFLLIAVTVLSAGLTGSFVANLLGLKRKSDQGWIILGAK